MGYVQSRLRSPVGLLLAAAMIVCVGCSGKNPTSTETTGAGGDGRGGSNGGGAAASGGRIGTGGANGGSAGGADGSGSGVGGTGTAATGGSAGSVGGFAGSAGGSAGSAGGRGGTSAGGSTGGSGGAHDTGGSSGSSGVGGGAGAPTDIRMAADVLNGLALVKPCYSQPGNCAGCTCDENSSSLLNTGMAPENQHLTEQFGGEAGAIYSVKLRVVGVAERYWYTGGTLDPTSKVFYTGGLPTIHSTQAPNKNLSPGQGACKIHPPQTDGSPSNFPIPFTVPPEVAPADSCYNGFNIFAMTVSSPKQSYFLNYTTDFDGVDRQPHAVYNTDYSVTIPIAGQAKVDFYIIDGDHHQVANTTMTVPNVKNTQIKQPYSGNFLELEVVDVSLQN